MIKIGFIWGSRIEFLPKIHEIFKILPKHQENPLQKVHNYLLRVFNDFSSIQSQLFLQFLQSTSVSLIQNLN